MKDTSEYFNLKLNVHLAHQLGSEVPLASLCDGQVTLLKVMRRFGCPLTRFDSLQIFPNVDKA